MYIKEFGVCFPITYHLAPGTYVEFKAPVTTLKVSFFLEEFGLLTTNSLVRALTQMKVTNPILTMNAIRDHLNDIMKRKVDKVFIDSLAFDKDGNIRREFHHTLCVFADLGLFRHNFVIELD